MKRTLLTGGLGATKTQKKNKKQIKKKKQQKKKQQQQYKQKTNKKKKKKHTIKKHTEPTKPQKNQLQNPIFAIPSMRKQQKEPGPGDQAVEAQGCRGVDPACKEKSSPRAPKLGMLDSAGVLGALFDPPSAENVHPFFQLVFFNAF